MKLKDLSREDLEEIIAEKGIGSDYVKRVKRVQRDVNLAILLGSASIVIGLTALALYKLSD